MEVFHNGGALQQAEQAIDGIAALQPQTADGMIVPIEGAKENRKGDFGAGKIKIGSEQNGKPFGIGIGGAALGQFHQVFHRGNADSFGFGRPCGESHRQQQKHCQ